MRSVWRWGWLLGAVACADADGDGARGGRDCDDDDARAFVGAAEVCDGVDNDCDGQIDEDVAFVAWQDRDGDGYGDPGRARRVCELPADGVLNGDDCDDLDATSFPGGAEVCDGADNDCNGDVDDGAAVTFFKDGDGDGHGVVTDTTEACLVPEGYSRVADDCDDTEPLAWSGAAEVCDGVDNDCNGQTDEALPIGSWPLDADGDGYGHPTATLLACGPGAPGASGTTDDCDDDDATRHPGAPETTRAGRDDDCDGYVDELQVPTDAPTVLAAVNLAPPGSVIQIVGTVEEDVDLTGHDFVFVGEGCERSALLGSGAGAVLLVDGGRVEAMTILGGRDSGMVVTGDVGASGLCVRGNVSPTSGGGVRVESGTLTLSDSLLADNVAVGDGGGVSVGLGAELVARRVRVLSNEADESGGGVHVAGGHIDVAASVFAANVAYRDGGGLGLAEAGGTAATGVVDQCTFVYNLSEYDTAFPTRADQSRGSAIGTSDVQSSLIITGTGFAWHRGVDDVVQILGNDSVIERSAFHRNVGRDLFTGWIQDAVTGDPDFVRFDPAVTAEQWDLRLMPGSPWIDAGSTTARDTDGTVADLGAYGGAAVLSDARDGYRADADGDGLSDPWERAWGLIVGVDDAGEDPDRDGLDHLGEQTARSSPRLADTDGDGWSDGEEVDGGTDPRVAGDRLPFAAIEVPRMWVTGLPLPLDGRGSFDPDSRSATLTWSVSPPAGSIVTTTASPSVVTSLTPDVAGTWRITLGVADARGSASFTVAVTVRSAVIVPDQQATLAAALTAAGTSGSVALRPGTWQGGLTLSGYTGTIFGLGTAAQVVIEGSAGSVFNVRDGATPRFQQVTIRGGAASASGDTHGGGIDCISGNVTLIDAVVEECSATGNGGGIYASNCPVTLDRATVRANTAQDGGGIYLSSSYLFMIRSAAVDNGAVGRGGGLRYTSALRDAMTIRNSLFQGNVADDGSAISLLGPQLADLVLVMGNLAVVDHDGPGAVITIERGAATLADSLLMSNRGAVVLEEAGGSLTAFRLASWGHAMPLTSAPAFSPLELVTAWPMMGSWVDDGDAHNDALWPRPGSPLLGRGSPHVDDLDATPGDIGLTGGLDARRSWLREAIDMDRDGMSDGWEIRYGLDPTVDDGARDLDGDGVSNLTEYLNYTLPDRGDTDGDGVPD